MTWSKRKKAQDQRRTRHQKNERAFLFTVEGHLLGEVERIPWEVALADSGGNVADAAMACGGHAEGDTSPLGPVGSRGLGHVSLLAEATPARMRNTRVRQGVVHSLHNADGSSARCATVCGCTYSLRGVGCHRRGDRFMPRLTVAWC